MGEEYHETIFSVGLNMKFECLKTSSAPTAKNFCVMVRSGIKITFFIKSEIKTIRSNFARYIMIIAENEFIRNWYFCMSFLIRSDTWAIFCVRSGIKDDKKQFSQIQWI